MNPHYYRSEHNPARAWHVEAERELRARVFELEREVARLRGELQIVRATCKQNAAILKAAREAKA